MVANNNSSHPLFLPTLHFQIADLKKFSWLHFDEKSGVDRVKSNNKRRPSVDSESSVEGSLMIKTKPTSIQPQPLKSSLRNTRPPRKTVRFDIDDHDQSGRTATTSHQRTKTLPQMTPINTFSQMPSIEEDPISPLSPVYPPDPDRLLQFLRACQDDTPLTPSPPTPATPATPTTRSPHSPKPVNLYMQTWLNALDDAAKNTRSARLYGTLPTDFGRQNKAATLSAMLTNRRFSADAVNPRVSDVLLPTSPGHQRNHSAPLSIPKQQEAFDRNMARIQQQQSRNQTPPLVRQDLCEDTDWDDEDELEDDLEDETSSNLKIYGPFKSEAEADLFLDLISDSPTMLSNPTFVI
ncbi:hypothetical protein HK102_013763 [Quaeritorhiza haematococci]|nr:hypothetical protein HK102_013763 [Quaeritorhiza haematococci]